MKEINVEEYQWLVANVRHYLNHEGEITITLFDGKEFVGKDLKEVIQKAIPTPNE